MQKNTAKADFTSDPVLKNISGRFRGMSKSERNNVSPLVYYEALNTENVANIGIAQINMQKSLRPANSNSISQFMNKKASGTFDATRVKKLNDNESKMKAINGKWKLVN